MANIGIDALKDKIDEKIVTNGEQEITAAVLNDVLQDSVDTLAENVSVSQNTLTIGGVEKGVLMENVQNPEWIDVKIDSEDKIFEGTKTDGTKRFSLDVEVGGNLNVEGNINGENLSDKVDKVAGKSLIDAEFASSQEVITNPEYLQVTTDSENKIVEAIKTDGTKVIELPLEIQGVRQETIDNPEWTQVTTDAEGKILEGIKKDGSKFISNLENDTEIKKYVDNKIAEHHLIIPDFYKEHINNKLDEVTEKLCSCGQNGDSFIFITDTHWEVNWMHSPSLINYILNNTEITKVFHGGDFIDGVYEDNTNYAKDLMRKFKFTHLYSIFGNHDQYIKIQEDGENRIYSDNNEVYSTYFKHLEKDINTEGEFYYYVDNPSQKIRYFVLDGHWTSNVDNRGLSLNYSEQLEWLEQKADEIGSDWSIIVLQHIIFGNQTMNGQVPVEGTVTKTVLAQQLIAKLDEIYDMPNMPNVIAIIAGHTHYDYHEYSEKGYPIIATNCDASYGFALRNGRWIDNVYNINRQDNSINAQCFDIFTIDKINRKIYATRVGYGISREFTF